MRSLAELTKREDQWSKVYCSSTVCGVGLLRGTEQTLLHYSIVSLHRPRSVTRPAFESSEISSPPSSNGASLLLDFEVRLDSHAHARLLSLSVSARTHVCAT